MKLKVWLWVLIGVAAAVGAAAVLFKIRAILLPFLFALAITYVLSPVVVYLETKGFSRTAAILAIYAVLLACFVLSVACFLPVLFEELENLGEALPGLTRDVQSLVSRVQRGYARTDLPQAVRQVVDDTIRSVENEILHLTRSAVDGLLGLFSSLFLTIIAPVLAFYILRDLERIKAWICHILPRDKGHWWEMLEDLDAVFDGFVRGQIIVALIVGSLSAVALSILRVRFALVLGLIAAVFELVPYFGPVLGAVPAVFLALLKSPLQAFYVLLAFIVIQQVQNAVISPKIMGDRVGLHPIAVIFAILAGGYLFGFWGIILAVPAAGVLRVVLIFLMGLLQKTDVYRVIIGEIQKEGEDSGDLQGS